MYCNEIGDEGAKEFAIALKSNKVGLKKSLLFAKIVDSFVAKALQLLDIGSNNIGNQGAQDLAQMLSENTVRQKYSL